jgi:type IV pilus assembly protein PilF
LPLAGCVLCLALLGACAGPVNMERHDIATASDQTDASRRANVRLELASAYFGRGQNSTALDEVKLALQANPRLVDAYNLRGLIYGAMSENGLAEESFRQALQLDPRNADTMHNYAWFLCQQRRYAEADTQFSQAVALPTNLGLQRSLLAQGVCQARDNHWAEAERSLSRAYELDPSNPTAAVNLSDVLYRRGEYERARFYVRRVNVVENQVSAQTLWLAARIERKLGQTAQVESLGAQLRNRYPQSPESLLYEKGLFDE